MRRIIIFFTVCSVVSLLWGVGVGSFVQHKQSQVSFKVTVPDGSTVKVFADMGGDAPFQYNPKNPLFTLQESQTIKIKVGIYDFVISPDTDYASSVTKFTVNKATTQVVINPDLSQEKLQSELNSQRNQITAAVGVKYENFANYYTISKVMVYKHGEWAGIVLTPKSDQYDPVRLVAHKNGGEWKVLSDPSIFVVGSLYKDVPSDVVAAINNL